MLLKARTFKTMTAGTVAPAVIASASNATTLLRHRSDRWLIGGSLGYAATVLLFPNIVTVGVGIWWVLNTVAHNFIHQPFYRSRTLNKGFALYLSILSGVPQQLWRERHLAHHAECNWRLQISRALLLQILAITLLWTGLFAYNLELALRTIVPGYSLGMLLCALQGHFEHAGGTTSNYGKLYNWIFFNDGFHVEHHDRPGAHWTTLPRARVAERVSRWPAALRWMDWFNLNSLEKLASRSRFLQTWVLRSHKQALKKLTAGIPEPANVAVVGGGLFPRTALVVHALWPDAQVTIFDANPEHLEYCKRWVRGDELLVHARVRAGQLPEADLVFIPLAFDQSKKSLYSSPSKKNVIVHDWLWGRRGRSVVTSWLLLKRMNLVTV